MYLFFYFILFFLLAFVLRSVLLWKNTGINPLTFGKKDDAHGYNGKVFAIISVLELIVLAIHAFIQHSDTYLIPIPYLQHDYAVYAGWALLLFSLLFVWVAQGQMATSWRIGIDEKNKTHLVTRGLFSISRNPIFLGMMVANLGLFLVLPNTFTLLIVCLSCISINTQVRLEEAFLNQQFGAEYLAYQKKVRRWF